MRGKTHTRIGMAVTAGICNLAVTDYIKAPMDISPMTFVFAMAGAILGSLLMDNDAKGTTISHVLPISNRIITWLAGKGVKACYHRHLFHSLLFLPALAALLAYGRRESTLDFAFACGLFLGLTAHALADAFLSNTWLLYPLRKKPCSLLHLSATENKAVYEKTERFCYKMAGLCSTVLTGSYFYLYLHH